MRFTPSAFAAKHPIGKQGDIVIPPKLVFAGRAMRSRLRKAHFVRQPINNYVEKAAHTQSKYPRKKICTN
jgi:hypothetical protein